MYNQNLILIIFAKNYNNNINKFDFLPVEASVFPK